MGDIHRPVGHAWVAPAELVFEDCCVGEGALLGEEGKGFFQAMDWIGSARLGVAAGCVGSAEFLVSEAVEYAETREAFGKPLIERQGVSFPLAEVAMDVERTRQLYRYAAWKVDSDEDTRKEVGMAKLAAATLEQRAADVAMQVHGGTGYSRRGASPSPRHPVPVRRYSAVRAALSAVEALVGDAKALSTAP